jgi:hypothetical protein
MSQDLQHSPPQIRRLGQERRNSARYPFTAMCDATEPKSGAKTIGRTSDLGRGGCYIDTIGPFPEGTNLIVRINRDQQTLRIAARVIFAQPGMGMGLAFAAAEPDQRGTLDQWIAELSGEPLTKPGSVTPASGASAYDSFDGVKVSGDQALEAVRELILLLLQKRVLTEAEGKSLLQKFL